MFIKKSEYNELKSTLKYLSNKLKASNERISKLEIESAEARAICELRNSSITELDLEDPCISCNLLNQCFIHYKNSCVAYHKYRILKNYNL